MKNLKGLKTLSVVLLIGAATVIADSVHQAGERNGNGDAMKVNLNEPNATNPARNNCQRYEKVNDSRMLPIETSHPEKTLSNSYNRSNYIK